MNEEHNKTVIIPRDRTDSITRITGISKREATTATKIEALTAAKTGVHKAIRTVAHMATRTVAHMAARTGVLTVVRTVVLTAAKTVDRMVARTGDRMAAARVDPGSAGQEWASGYSRPKEARVAKATAAVTGAGEVNRSTRVTGSRVALKRNSKRKNRSSRSSTKRTPIQTLPSA